MKILGSYPGTRLRRNRKNEWSRRLVKETNLSTDDLIWPIFLTEGKNKKKVDNQEENGGKTRVGKSRSSETLFYRFLVDFWSILGAKWGPEPLQKGIDFQVEKRRRKVAVGSAKIRLSIFGET